VSIKNWLIMSAVVGAFSLLLLIASSAESVPGAFVWLMLFVSIWGAITLCCCMFRGAEMCATYVREQEAEGYEMQTTQGETATTAPTSEQPYTAL